MTKQSFLEYCLNTYNTTPDYPFDEDFETTVLRHSDNRKWYAIVMRVSLRKFGFDSDEIIDVVNLKLPTEMFGSFGASDGVYPAYHMNKLHWISVLLPYSPDDVVQFLVNDSRNNSGEMKELMGYIARHSEDLEKLLNDEQREIFDKFRECWNEYVSLAEAAIFEYAFKLGARLTLESLIEDN